MSPESKAKSLSPYLAMSTSQRRASQRGPDRRSQWQRKGAAVVAQVVSCQSCHTDSWGTLKAVVLKESTTYMILHSGILGYVYNVMYIYIHVCLYIYMYR